MEWFVLLPFWEQIIIIVMIAGGLLTLLGVLVGHLLSKMNDSSPYPDSYNWMDDLEDKLHGKK